MNLIFSFIFIAVGAIMFWAMDAHQWQIVNIHIVGMILMIVGASALIFSFMMIITVRSVLTKAMKGPSDRRNHRSSGS